MKEYLLQPEKQLINQERFKLYSENTRIFDESEEELPEAVRKMIDKKILHLEQTEKCSAALNSACNKVEYADGTMGHIVKILKNFPESVKKEEAIILIDINESEIAGYAEMNREKLSQADGVQEEPFESFTSTDSKYRGRGLGKRRILTLNAIAQALYSQPLSSDTVMLDQVKHIWENLEKEGIVERLEGAGRDRFRFIDIDKSHHNESI